MSKQTMNKRNLGLIAGMLAIGLVAASIIGGQSITAAAQQEEEQESTEQPTVSTSGSASVDVVPDKVSITIGVETDGETAAEASASNTELMEKVIAALRELGITDEQMTTSIYSVLPIYESRDAAEVCIQIYPPPQNAFQETK